MIITHDDVLDQISEQTEDLVTMLKRPNRRNQLAVMAVLAEDFELMAKRLRNEIHAATSKD